jgi:uncharacterized protein (DUF305 family)
MTTLPSGLRAPRAGIRLVVRPTVLAFAALAVGAATARAQAPAAAAASVSPLGRAPVDSARLARVQRDSARLPYTEADVRFMRDMIGHHAQAIRMARLAPAAGASPSVLTLAQRIINAQSDEIGIMQQWLRDRRRPAPEVLADGTVREPRGAAGAAEADVHAGHEMPAHASAGHATAGHGAHDPTPHAGHVPAPGAKATGTATPKGAGRTASRPAAPAPPAPTHDAAAHDHALMPGMLSEAQMRALAEARGSAFDERFLTSMIEHHRGATLMVRQLFATPGAGQDETVFKFAADVNVDQTTEIERMQRMLVALMFERGPTDGR